MFDITRDPRSAEVYRTLCSETHEFIFSGDFIPDAGELPLRHLPVFINEMQSEMVDTAMEDFKAFLREAFLLKEPDSGTPFTVVVSRTMLADENKRAHSVTVDGDRLEIKAAGEWGAAGAFYHLQRLLRLRGVPAVRKGTLSSRPALDPSLAYPAFKRETTTDFDYPEAYNEGYLKRIARAGYTGFHLNLSTSMFSRSAVYTELDNPEAEKNLEILEKIIAAARRCSLEVFLSYYTVPLAGDHDLFKRFPAMRGARIVGTDSLHSLCSSSPDTLNYYLENLTFLFSRARGLGGVLLIVGCEGFLHCHTAPELDREQKSTCPVCGKKDPEETVATLMNAVAAGVKRVSPEALCVIWTYGIHTWTSDKGAKLVSLLSKECEVMTNFDTGDKFSLEGAVGNCFDYSLRCVGPGEMFLKHEALAARKSLSLLAKCESGTSLEFYNFTSFPANLRWGRKYSNILKSSAAGALFNWKFMGYLGEIPQELAGWMSWEGYADDESLLKKIAERDFGQENTAGILNAWKCFDAAMEFHPFSNQTAGYFKGPFYIAFTHPLILNPLNPGVLSEEFWGVRNSEHIPGGRRVPRFVTDLSWTWPFGADACLRALSEMERLWEEGCSGIPLCPRTEKHAALCRAVLCTIRTAANVVKFFLLRDDLFRGKQDVSSMRGKLEELRAVAENEYENTLAGLRCMEQNPMLGFQYTYRYTFTREMCESKLKHTRQLIDRTIPQMFYSFRFTLGEKAGWLWPEDNGCNPPSETT